jgi:hypothetical protein
MLSATISDLAISEATFKDALHDPGCPLAHRFHLHRQLAGRVIEAWRVVGAIRDHEEIATFVNSAGGAMRRSGCWKSSRGRRDLRDRAVGHRRSVAQLVQRDTGASAKLVEIDREPICDCAPRLEAILTPRRGGTVRFEINQLPPALGTVDRFRADLGRRQARSPSLAGTSAILARRPVGRLASVHRVCLDRNAHLRLFEGRGRCAEVPHAEREPPHLPVACARFRAWVPRPTSPSPHRAVTPFRSYARGVFFASRTFLAFASRARQLATAPEDFSIPLPIALAVSGSSPSCLHM